MSQSRIPEFYKRSVAERLRLLVDRHLLSPSDYRLLVEGNQVLPSGSADKMIENVVGVFGLPMGLGLNFLINDRDYVVPLTVEEPSIVAALSAAAKLVRKGGGFATESSEPLLIGQVQVVDVPHPTKAQHAILQNREAILNLANSLHPKMVARGGGARDVEVFLHPSARGDMLVVHLLVDTCDAMGANLVNTMCEGIAPLVESLCDGRVFLRILSNLTDRAMVQARCSIPTDALAARGHTGAEVRDGIVLANDFAVVDPYRAVTHNKGIMNGIDAVAIATGNDWRAIEAAAHAYAGRGTSYTALTTWRVGRQGALCGQIELPLKVGTMGGNLATNPAVGVAHRLLGVSGARELAEVMAAVGLAQNFSALRALATDGIQQGHMSLHARSVAMSAGAPADIFDAVVQALIDSGDIKVWKAQQIVAEMRGETRHVVRRRPVPPRASEAAAFEGAGHGKVILLGEHAVVYGRHALGAPLPGAIRARVQDTPHEGVHLVMPGWGVEGHLRRGDQQNSLHHSLDVILTRLGLRERNMVIEVHSHLPRAMGLGGSAALAVAVIRALSMHFALRLDDEAINRLAFASDQVAHGNPSGVDNTLATYGRPMLFRRGEPPHIEPVSVRDPVPLVIGISGIESLTAKMVAQVERAWRKNPKLYDGIFEDIDALVVEAARALARHDLDLVGELMNINQGLLNALRVSSWALEEMIEIARNHGALGAKLTGSGGGGSIIALCPHKPERVVDAIVKAGYRAVVATLGGTGAPASEAPCFT